MDQGKEPAKNNFYRFYERAKTRGRAVLIMEGDRNVEWSHPKELAELLEQTPVNK